MRREVDDVSLGYRCVPERADAAIEVIDPEDRAAALAVRATRSAGSVISSG
jgi:hypothetical protein